MSEVLLLFDVERENTVCSLFGVNTASSLTALRAAVTDQVSELIPEHFLFARDATQQIPKSAEDFVIINSITSREVLETSRGVIVFTNDEIENAVGREKQRRTFWNQKAKQLSKTLLPKAKIYEKIHADWRLQKSENLLQQGRADVELANNTGNGSPSTSSKTKAKVKKGTLQNNIARVKMYKAEYTKLSNEVKELLVGKPTENVKTLRHPRARLDLSKSNLKKAQDAMRKTQDAMRKKYHKTYNDVSRLLRLTISYIVRD
ncbi:Hypothetical predicted protein [Paramuricea clavata]|uniref:Uncharacterized protein n=1 Tax=Paramuricea clavata TaxID=317549 RepID=A0A6S7IE40_PARCT|nr:Hypothetical predicted protein [Paramuricea clavata]